MTTVEMAHPVLLVDDDVSLAQALGLAVESVGIPVDHCSSGELAIELLQARQYPVAIIDVVLGGGISGLYVVNAIRQLPAARRPLVIVITGANVESLRGIDRSVVNAILLKPLNLDLFSEYVLATYRHSVATRPAARPVVQTFCGSCKSPLTPWIPDRLSVSGNVAQSATFERWLDTACTNCGASPRVAGGHSAWRP